MNSRLLFLSSLWMAISVALLSALAPLGPPSSRMRGSAFNPATTTVVLKARSVAVQPTIRATEPDGAGQGGTAFPAMKLLLAVASLLITSQYAGAASLQKRAPTLRLSHFRLSRKCPRAPPFRS